MGERKSSRLGTTAALKARKAEDHILLARGLSARMIGANVPLATLSQEEMERDLRHMEAFTNACTTYAQQYYIYNNNTAGKDDKDGKHRAAALQPTPLIAMPVRIDPEEEKRLANLRQKIQHCEAQREVYEGQYLSLRAHYIYLSQQLKSKREDVNKRFAFLQDQVQKRGKLVALQRVRLQILRDTLQCVQYREKYPVEHQQADSAELYTAWSDIERDWKKAEDDIKQPAGIVRWSASHVPKIPPGVPLLLSQLAEQPGQAAAWGTCGAFGAKPHDLLWIENQIPTAAPDTADELPALREEVAKLKAEIENERSLSKEYQLQGIARRKKNDELVAMMALLRTETEAAVARHNILLESDIAKKAALQLHEEEVRTGNDGTSSDAAEAGEDQGESGATDSNSNPLPESSGLKEDDENDGDDEGGEEDEEDGEIEDGPGKRSLDDSGESPRSKRRRV